MIQAARGEGGSCLMFEDVLICYWKSLSGSWISVTNVRSKILGALAATCHLPGEIMTELVSLYYGVSLYRCGELPHTDARLSQHNIGHSIHTII